MSEPIPESIPTSSFRRPTKRAKTDKASDQSSQIDALFANPQHALEVNIGPKAKTLSAPPEIVTNVQGSSAGAGSGEFHVYKASRRREYDRLRAMDEEVANEEADRKWEEQREEAKRQDEAKLSKNRARREKQKARQSKAKAGNAEASGEDKTNKATAIKKKLGPAHVPARNGEKGGDDQPEATAAEEDGITFLEDG